MQVKPKSGAVNGKSAPIFSKVNPRVELKRVHTRLAEDYRLGQTKTMTTFDNIDNVDQKLPIIFSLFFGEESKVEHLELEESEVQE